ncbi:MAG: hypothetical protein FWC74_10005 [Candidatus Bathyarchaeota archaeon]|nr:hypothetical protein [Candidatus Termitimicrobium sp.]
MSNNQTLEAIIDKVFSCTTVVQAHTTKETSKPTQYTITLKSPKEMGAKLGLEPASITITIKAEADVAKEIFPQDHAFKIIFQKTNLHYNNPADNTNSQRDRQSTLPINPNPGSNNNNYNNGCYNENDNYNSSSSSQSTTRTDQQTDQTDPEAEDPTEAEDQTETAEIDPEYGTAFWSYEEESQGPLDDDTCEAPSQ